MHAAQAIELAEEFIRDQGYAASGCKVSVEFVTRESVLKAERLFPLPPKRRASIIEHILSQHRDYWIIGFEFSPSAECLPDSMFVHVDDETGEVSIPSSL